MAEYHSAFGEAGFSILWDGDLANMSGWEQESFASTNHIPGSNRNITFLMGNGPLQRTFEVLCETQTHYANLRAMRQTVAVLRVPAAMNDLTDSGVSEINYFGSAYAEIADVTLLNLTATRSWVDGARTVLATFQRDEPEAVEVAEMTTTWTIARPVPVIDPPTITFLDVDEAFAANVLPVQLFVSIGGEVIEATEAHTSHSVDQPIGTCTVYCAAPRPASVTMNAEIEIEMGYPGAVRRTFHGFIPSDESVSDDRGNLVRIEGVGWCSRLAYPEYAGVEIAGPVSLKDAFRALCQLRGIPTYLSDNTTYVDGSTTIELGGNDDIDGGHVRFDNKTDPLTWVTRNAELYGYRVFDSPDGTVRMARVSGLPPLDVTDREEAYDFVTGDDIEAISVEVNLRANPNITDPILAVIPQGGQAVVTSDTIVDVSGTLFALMTYGGVEGWGRIRTAGGFIYFYRITNAAALEYAEGVNVFALQYSRSTDEMYTYIEVEGARYTDATGGTLTIRSIPDAVPSDPALYPPGYRQLSVRAQDIVTNDQAEGVRNAYEVNLSEVQEYVSWEYAGRPDLQPGDVVQVTGESHDLLAQRLWLMSLDQSVTDQGYIARMEGWYGAGTALAAGNDCVVQTVTIPGDGTVHLGDETVSWYKDPTPDGTEYTIDIEIVSEDYTSLRLSGRVHGSNTYGTNTPSTGSVIEVWQLDDPSVPESGSNELSRKGSLELPTANEEYNKRRNYSSSNTYWTSFDLPMPGSLKAGDAELRLIAGDNVTDRKDDYEIKDLVLTTCGVGIPDLPGQA